MNAHIDKVCINVQKKYGILRKIRRYIREDTAILIYKVRIRPHFDYGDYMVDSGTQNKIDKLERIQDRIVRTIEFKHTAENRENIDKLKYNIEKLCVRRKQNLLKIMFGQSRNEMNIDSYRPERILRSRNKVKLKSKFTRINKIQKSPYYRGIILWDTIPQNLQCEQSKVNFKNAINRLNIV